MKFIIMFSAFLAIALAKPSVNVLAPLTYVLGTPIQQQYHSQDALGQYAYGYTDGLSSKQESKTFDGVTRGAYNYVDANGKLQSVVYTADALNGFRVAATNLPKAIPAPEPIPQLAPLPVTDTLEVLAARDAHLRAIDEAKLRTVVEPEQIVVKTVEFNPAELPKPVEDTEEVARAKAEHLAAKKEIELRNSAIELSVIAQPTITAAPIPVPIARIAPTLNHIAPINFFQPTLIRSIPLPSGFAYSYGYAHTPFAWDSRVVIPDSTVAAH